MRIASRLLLKMPLRADSIPEIVAKAKPAIVEIVAIDAAGAPMKFGTGFFISRDGLAVTNFHVIDGAASLKAVGTDGSIFAFQRLVAQGTGVDLALLQFQVTDVPFLRLGTSADKVEGEKVIVIGNPTGFTGTVSDGVISAFREKRSMIQISAPISLGSSGSPVLDAGGKVIGVATLIAKEGQNLNFAIAVEQLSTIISSQSIALPKAEITNQDVSGGTGRIARLTPTVLMVTAKSMSVTFQENGGSLVFFGNGRSVAVSIAKPENTEIGHVIRFEPGLTRSSAGEWYLPYPLALTIQAFLDPDIRPEFAPDHFYLVNAWQPVRSR
jgi:S1-C subfamily serine protease